MNIYLLMVQHFYELSAIAVSISASNLDKDGIMMERNMKNDSDFDDQNI